MSPDLLRLSASELHRAYKRRDLSPVEVASAILDRAEALNEEFNAFCLIDRPTTLAMARASEARWHKGEAIGPGDGIPTTVKDVMLTKGWPTLRGSLTVDPNQAWDTDSPCVARLREQGAVFLGKTTTPEFGWKALDNSPLNGVTRNPWDPARTPGGSSGGAAVAAALGLGVWHTASDAGGSIRVPAAFCGVFGFKPTLGIVPLYPTNAFSGLSHHGPITRSVEDAVAMLRIMSQADPRDATAAPACARDFSAETRDDIAGLRIGYARTAPGVAVDPDIASLTDASVATLSELGGQIEDFVLDLSGAREMVEPIWSVGCALVLHETPAASHDKIDPGLRAYADAGRAVSATELRLAQIARETLAERLNLLHERFDVIVTPTVPILPFAIGHDVPPDGPYKSWLDWASFSYPFNLSQQPAASIPCGLTPAGLPAAFQVVGPRFGDQTVLRVACAYERAAGFIPLPR